MKAAEYGEMAAALDDNLETRARVDGLARSGEPWQIVSDNRLFAAGDRHGDEGVDIKASPIHQLPHPPIHQLPASYLPGGFV